MSSLYLSRPQKSCRFHRISQIKSESFYEGLTRPPTHPLRPVIPDNAWGLCITAPAGTELGAPYSCADVNYFFTHKRFLRPEGLRQPRGVAWSGFRPLPNILDCSHP